MEDKNILRRKYCFTPCFKRKMSRGWQTAIGVIATLTVVVGTMLAFGVIGFLIGYAYQWLMGLPFEDTIEIGIVIIIFATVGSLVIFWLAKEGASIVRNTTKFVKKRYEGEPYQCSIFERCEDD